MTATMQATIMPYSMVNLPLKHLYCETQTQLMQNAITPYFLFGKVMFCFWSAVNLLQDLGRQINPVKPWRLICLIHIYIKLTITSICQWFEVAVASFCHHFDMQVMSSFWQSETGPAAALQVSDVLDFLAVKGLCVVPVSLHHTQRCADR